MMRRRQGAVMAAAVFAFAAALVTAAAPGAAASYTLHFTGTVTAADGIFLHDVGVAPGDPVSGSIGFDPLASSPSVQLPGPNSIGVFPQGAGAFSFHVSHPGAFSYVASGSGNGQIESSGSPIGARLAMNAGDSLTALQLTYITDGSRPALASLVGLPTSSSGILALLAGDVRSAVGSWRVLSIGNISFALDVATATTPVPATLPLLVSALAALGFAARRRPASRKTGNSLITETFKSFAPAVDVR
jgi:hypothetical protein